MAIQAGNLTVIDNDRRLINLGTVDSTSAAAIIDQQVAGASATALHRSPNAITSMSVYDTSKDSDGGAWTEKCQHTSWYNEPLSGKWLGAQVSELNARYEGSTLGPELIANGDFTTNTNSWAAASGATLSSVSSQLRIDGVSSFFAAYQQVSVVSGKLYKISIDTIFSNYNVRLQLGSSWQGQDLYLSQIGVGNTTTYIRATSATLSVGIQAGSLSTGVYYGLFDNVSVKEVIAINTASNDYYQSSADGKFYRLWKNLISYSEELGNTSWNGYGATISSNSGAAPNGTWTADRVLARTDNTYQSKTLLKSNSVSITAGTTYAFSIYAKSDGVRYFSLFCDIASNLFGATTYFDLQTQTVTQGTGSIVPIGDGWYRCIAIQTATTTGIARPAITLQQSGTGSQYGQNNWSGDGISGMYFYGAQIEQGSVATTYEPKGIEGSVSEVFRGNKREFPKLSALISESDNTTIYDLTEPNRPMWMRMTTSMFPAFEASGGYIPALSSANGTIGFSRINGGNVGEVWLLNFVRDIVYARGSTLSSYNATYINGNIADRLKYQRNLQYVSNSGYGFIVPSFVIIKPPVKPLKIQYPVCDPIVYIQHEGGISVIRDDMVRISNGVAGHWPSFTQTNARGLFYHHTSTGANAQFIPQIETAAFTQISIPTTSYPDFIRATPSRVVGANDRFVAATSNRVGLLKINEQGGALKSTGAVITNTYNTGHQVGDIRRTYLSDISTGEINGDTIQLITPSSKDINWTDNGNGTFTTTGSYGALTFTSPIFKLGKVFTITFTLVRNGNTLLASNKTTGVWDISLGSSGTFTYTLPIYNSESFTFYGNGLNGTLSNIYVTEKIPDRSYKASSATISGTLTKTPVATGSQLVAYSGFSA